MHFFLSQVRATIIKSSWNADKEGVLSQKGVLFQ
jgi:hypothetical protein